MIDIDYPIKFNQDLSILPETRKRYCEITSSSNKIRSVFITMPIENWISTNSLNQILIFIQSLKVWDCFIEISLELFSNEIVEKIFDLKISASNDSCLLLNIKRKIIFYESMQFREILNALNVQIYPPTTTFVKLQKVLDAYKSEAENTFSSKILPLSPLVDDETEQHKLTNRMQNLTNIIFNNAIFRENSLSAPGEKRKDFIDKVRTFSNKIMYELVKNIYQHSGSKNNYGVVSKGFACAQIYPSPQIRHKLIPKVLVDSVMRIISDNKSLENTRTLGITINDWGVGLIHRVKSTFWENVDNNVGDQLSLFQESINNIPDNDFFKLAILTDYSSRKKSLSYKNISLDDYWHEDNYSKVKLEPMGYGMIYCLGFIGLMFGRMRIICNGTVFSIFAKPKTAFITMDQWKSTYETSKLLRSNLDDYYYYNMYNLPDNQRRFPGTQILIEVPVKNILSKFRGQDK